MKWKCPSVVKKQADINQLGNPKLVLWEVTGVRGFCRICIRMLPDGEHRGGAKGGLGVGGSRPPSITVCFPLFLLFFLQVY